MKMTRIPLLAALVILPALPFARAEASRPAHSPRWAAEPAITAQAPAQAVGTYLDALAAEAVHEVNLERAKAGLPALRVNGELEGAARVRAREIALKFSHTRPDGSSWRTVSALAYAENIAVGQRTADKVTAAWLTSSGHRANILRKSFGSVGMAALRVGGVTYWVQLFGK